MLGSHFWSKYFCSVEWLFGCFGPGRIWSRSSNLVEGEDGVVDGGVGTKGPVVI